jgi:type I restriction enzyme S subunit
MTELPTTWAKEPLGLLGSWSGGGTPSTSEARFWNGGIPWVSPKDMKQNRIAETQDTITEEALGFSAAMLIPENSVMIVTRSGILRHSLPVAINTKPVALNQDLKAITPVEAVSSEYLCLALQCFERDILHQCCKAGTTVQSIEVPRLKAFRVPVPPLPEQHRIVAKIEELFSELDKGIENLKQAKAQLAVYRQALLKHAFEGKLTTDWRKANGDNLESADQLLARIRSEREARTKQQLAAWKIASQNWETSAGKGPKPAKPREPKELRPLADDVQANLPSLPRSWAWDALGWMTNGVEYGSAAKSLTSGTHVVLRMGNLQNGRLNWDDLAFSNDPDEIAQYLLHTGDVLFNRTNSPEWVGKTGLYRGERPALFAGYLIRINHSTNVVRSEYLNWFLNSPIAKQYGNTVKTDGVNQSNINGDKLVNYPFPYCSLAEQDEIVHILEQTVSLIDRSLEEIDTNLAKSEALRQSILKKAFAGELVPQDPNDEPASELLARIRAERGTKSNGRDNFQRKKRHSKRPLGTTST